MEDGKLFDYLRALLCRENLFIEPSACAAFQGPVKLRRLKGLLEKWGLGEERLGNACHVAWATGGSMVPQEERAVYLNTYL